MLGEFRRRGERAEMLPSGHDEDVGAVGPLHQFDRGRVTPRRSRRDRPDGRSRERAGPYAARDRPLPTHVSWVHPFSTEFVTPRIRRPYCPTQRALHRRPPHQNTTSSISTPIVWTDGSAGDPVSTRDGHNPAYGVAGTGPTDVVWFFEVQMRLDLLWTDPYMHSLFERLATCSRAVCFQRRGFGLSDPVDHVPTIEQQAEDVPAVMDAEQIRHATLIEDRPDRPGSRSGNWCSRTWSRAIGPIPPGKDAAPDSTGASSSATTST